MDASIAFCCWDIWDMGGDFASLHAVYEDKLETSASHRPPFGHVGYLEHDIHNMILIKHCVVSIRVHTVHSYPWHRQSPNTPSPKIPDLHGEYYLEDATSPVPTWFCELS
jgi:hypothetical protein